MHTFWCCVAIVGVISIGSLFALLFIVMFMELIEIFQKPTEKEAEKKPTFDSASFWKFYNLGRGNRGKS